jgi:4'-phosphopantetheinyl transferase
LSVHVEIQRVDQVLRNAPDDPDSWLTPSESARLQGLKLPARRAQYLAGHWLTRVLLARLHASASHEWTLHERRSLPPRAEFMGAEPRSATHLSISHSGDWVAAAVALAPIGIDLEQYPRRHSLNEVEELLLAVGENRGSIDADGLLQRWVAKEARIKQECGEALPETLRQVRLCAAPWSEASVRVYRAHSFFLGLAAPPQLAQRWSHDDELTPVQGWSVDEADHAA